MLKFIETKIEDSETAFSIEIHLRITFTPEIIQISRSILKVQFPTNQISDIISLESPLGRLNSKTIFLIDILIMIIIY